MSYTINSTLQGPLWISFVTEHWMTGQHTFHIGI